MPAGAGRDPRAGWRDVGSRIGTFSSCFVSATSRPVNIRGGMWGDGTQHEKCEMGSSGRRAELRLLLRAVMSIAPDWAKQERTMQEGSGTLIR